MLQDRQDEIEKCLKEEHIEKYNAEWAPTASKTGSIFTRFKKRQAEMTRERIIQSTTTFYAGNDTEACRAYFEKFEPRLKKLKSVSHLVVGCSVNGHAVMSCVYSYRSS